MQQLLLILEFISIVDVFIWGTAIFATVLIGWAVFALLNRPSRKNVVQGLPRE